MAKLFWVRVGECVLGKNLRKRLFNFRRYRR